MKLIDKDALVAEIMHHVYFTPEHTNAFIEGEEHAYGIILSFLKTLEVKEVDLEKEVEKYLLTNAAFLIGGDSKLVVHHIAKHFFELGLKTQKGE